MTMISRFIEANRRISRIIEGNLPVDFVRHLHTIYKFEVADALNRRPGQVVIDIGGGRSCPFLPFVREPERHLFIVVDCSDVELRANDDVPDRIVADASAAGLPIAPRSIDMIVSRSVLEHLPNNDQFFANCAEVLHPGGMLIHTFSGKYAPFSIMNSMLPNRCARWLINMFHPNWSEECGFPAYYDRCYFTAIDKILTKHRFYDIKFSFRFYQSIYFDFCLPMYLIMLLFDLVIWRFGIRNLACGLLVTARAAGVEGRAPMDKLEP